jgi:hypothetical protein
MSNCLSPQASGTAACRRRVAADGHTIAVVVTAHAAVAPMPLSASRAPSPRPAPQQHHHQPHHPPRAIILHPHHAYRLPRPLPVVLPPPQPPAAARAHSLSRYSVIVGGGSSNGNGSGSGPSLDSALPLDALTAVAARLGDGRSLAAFAATCRSCKTAAYDERLWRRECERRFGPIMAQPPPPPPQQQAAGTQGGSGNDSGFSWRRLYAFNAHAYDAVVAATREAERARAMSRLLGASAARRWVLGRAALGAAA